VVGSISCGSEPKESVAFEIQIQALKEMLQIRHLITEPFENFDFAVESFNAATFHCRLPSKRKATALPAPGTDERCSHSCL
jgi:hypothetical protein